MEGGDNEICVYRMGYQITTAKGYRFTVQYLDDEDIDELVWREPSSPVPVRLPNADIQLSFNPLDHRCSLSVSVIEFLDWLAGTLLGWTAKGGRTDEVEKDRNWPSLCCRSTWTGWSWGRDGRVSCS